MLMYSFKFNRKKVFLAVFCALVLIVGIVLIVSLSSGELAPTGKKLVVVKTEEQRLAFIKQFGWEIDPEPAEVMEVLIPAEFDKVLTNYNEIQKKQGYDLTKYAGKTVKRWSYIVKNYPDKPDGVRISLLVYNDKVIGGDVACMELNGFMHGFAPESGAAPTVVTASELTSTGTSDINENNDSETDLTVSDVVDTEQLEADAEQSGGTVATDGEVPSN